MTRWLLSSLLVLLAPSLACAEEPRYKLVPELGGWWSSTVPDTTSLGTISATTVSHTGFTCSGTDKLTIRSDGQLVCATDQSGGGAAHALLSVTHSDTVASAVSRGSLIYGNSTPAWDELNVGAANSVLTADGTDAAWSTTPTVTSLTATNTVTGQTVSATSTLQVRSDIIQDITGTGLSIVGGALTASGSSNSFETIDVPAGTDPVADSATDTLTITETSFLTITGTAGTDTIDITQVTTDLGTDGLIAANAVALTTDTTGNYVAEVADGTGIDGTAAAEGATYTPTFDATEINSLTWGAAGAFTTMTFDSGATDPVLTAGNGTLTIAPGGSDLIVTDDVEVQDTTPHVRWTDTTASEDDFEAYADGNAWTLNNSTDSVEYMRIDGSHNVRIDDKTWFVDSVNNVVGMGTILADTPVTNEAVMYLAEATSVINLYHLSSGSGATLGALLSGGTLINPTVPANGNIVFRLDGSYWGGSYLDAAGMTITVDGTPGVNDVPARITFDTACDGCDATTERLRISANGNVTVGSSGLTLAKLGVDGSADEIQLLVQGNATQTTNLAVFENSAGTDQAVLTNAGNLTIAGDFVIDDASNTPALTWQSDAAGDDDFGDHYEPDVLTRRNTTTGLDLMRWKAGGNIVIPGTLTFAANTPYGTTLQTGTQTQEITYTLPVSAGTAGQILEIASVSGNTITLEWDADGGGGGNSFETWAVPDANNIVADSATDTATLTETAGFDITGNAGTDTVNFAVDLTEVSTLTLGAGAFTTLTFDAGATDPILTAATTSLTFSGSGGTTANLLIDDQGAVRFFEEDAGGGNYKGFVAPATITADTTCTFEDDANFIPDSCVGDGTDAGGTDTNADKVFSWPMVALPHLEPAESIPPIAKDAGTNVDLFTVDFDQSTDECRTFMIDVPPDITAGGTVTFAVTWYAASVTTNDVIWDVRHNSGVADGVDPDQAVTTETASACTAPGTAGQIDRCTWTETQTNLAWAANDLVVGMVCRDANNGSDTFAADAKAVTFAIIIPRS